MRVKTFSKPNGYIAITASILLSLLIMAVAISLGAASISSRSENLDFELKKQSFFAARSCLDKALLKLALDSGYAGNETLGVEGTAYQCVIRPVISSPPNKIIQVRSQINGATTNLQLTVNASQLSTVSLEEVVSF